MTFQNKVVVVTGGAQGIGKCCAECFEREGAIVHVIDIQQGPWFVGDLANKADLERWFLLSPWLCMRRRFARLHRGDLTNDGTGTHIELTPATTREKGPFLAAFGQNREEDARYPPPGGVLPLGDSLSIGRGRTPGVQESFRSCPNIFSR